MPIIRTEQQVTDAMMRAQKAAFDAQDNDDIDDGAEAAYGLLQWLLGYSDTDPTLEMAEDL